MTRHRGFGNRPDWPEAGAGVVFGDPNKQPGNRQPRNAAKKQRHAGNGLSVDRRHDTIKSDELPCHQANQNQRQTGGHDQAPVERAHDVL